MCDLEMLAQLLVPIAESIQAMDYPATSSGEEGESDGLDQVS
jgi:hypothetical protein